MKTLNWVAYLLCTIGAINWGLVAFLHFNLVEFIARIIPIPMLNLVVYGLVSIAGLYCLFLLITKDICCKR